jgi:hypothetical protein
LDSIKRIVSTTLCNELRYSTRTHVAEEAHSPTPAAQQEIFTPGMINVIKCWFQDVIVQISIATKAMERVAAALLQNEIGIDTCAVVAVIKQTRGPLHATNWALRAK